MEVIIVLAVVVLDAVVVGMVAVAVSMILYGVPPELCVRYVIVCT